MSSQEIRATDSSKHKGTEGIRHSRRMGGEADHEFPAASAGPSCATCVHSAHTGTNGLPGIDDFTACLRCYDYGSYERRSAAGAAPASSSDATACARPCVSENKEGGARGGDEVRCGTCAYYDVPSPDEPCGSCRGPATGHQAWVPSIAQAEAADDATAYESYDTGASAARLRTSRDEMQRLQEQIAQDMLTWGWVAGMTEAVSALRGRVEALRGSGISVEVLAELDMAADMLARRVRPHRDQCYERARAVASAMGAEVRHV